MARASEFMGLGLPTEPARLLSDRAAVFPTTMQLMGVGMPPALADALGDKRIAGRNPSATTLCALGMSGHLATLLATSIAAQGSGSGTAPAGYSFILGSDGNQLNGADGSALYAAG